MNYELYLRLATKRYLELRGVIWLRTAYVPGTRFSRPFAHRLVGSMVVTRRGREARSRSQRPTLPEALEWGPSMAVWCLRACLARRRLHALHGSIVRLHALVEPKPMTRPCALLAHHQRPPGRNAAALGISPRPLTLSTSLPTFTETKTKKQRHTHHTHIETDRTKLHPPGVQCSSHLEFPNAHCYVHCQQNGTFKYSHVQRAQIVSSRALVAQKCTSFEKASRHCFADIIKQLS